MLNPKSCKIRKSNPEKTSRGRPKAQKSCKNFQFSLKKLQENPNLMYQLEFPAKINKLIFESPKIDVFYRTMQKENRKAAERAEKESGFCDRIHYFPSKKKQDFFDFVSLILESTQNQLGLSSLCSEMLSWILQYFVNEMDELNVEENQRKDLDTITQQILNRIDENALISWKLHDYFDRNFFYRLFGVFEECRKFFEKIS